MTGLWSIGTTLSGAGGVDVSWVHPKDERTQMGLGSFKALGAAYAIAADAQHAGKPDRAGGLAGRTDGAASAGNDGLSLAADTRIFAARAGIFAAASVPNASAGRLRPHWAVVEDAGAIYKASMVAAADAAARNEWMLVSESS